MESKYSVYTSVSTALAVGGTRAAGGGNASGRVATAAFLRCIILYWRFESSSAAAFLVEAYSAMFDTEKFIFEIELRPAIYNVTLKEYSNKHIKAKCWNEVGETMYENWSSMTSEEKDEKDKYNIYFKKCLLFINIRYSDNTVFGNIKIWVGCQMFLSYYTGCPTSQYRSLNQ